MTQASVESLAIKNFIQEFSSAILSASVSIVIQTDSSAGNQWLQDWEFQEDHGTSSSSIFGFRMRSRKANSNSRRSELTSILQTFSQNVFQHQFLVSIFPVSISSRFIHKGQNQFFYQHNQVNQFSVHPTLSHPQHHLHRSRRRCCQASCSQSTLIIKSIFVRDSVKHQDVSRGFSDLLVEGADQESIALRRQHVSHQDSEVQENQESDAGVSESVQENSGSDVHGQQHVPPQNHESTSQWSSWIRSCFSVSVSLSSLSWRRRRRQGQGRNQENHEEINQRLSHLYLRASRIMSYVLFYSVFCSFVIFLFNSLHPSSHPSVQKSSAQPFVTEAVSDSISESELIASASLASLQPITSAITSVIMAMSAVIRSAHEAASAVAGHPQPSDDVVMVSADPILIVNAQDQPAIESAEIRTEIAMSGLTVSGSSAPGSLVKYAIMASLPSERMDMCHLSEDVKLFASNFKTSGDTFDFKQFMDSQAQHHWLILNDAEFKLFNQHHVLQVPRVKEPSGGHILNWKIHESLQDAIYHMIYLTVAHCVRHGSPAASADLSTVYTIVSGVMLPSHLQHFEEEYLFGIKSLNLNSHAPGHLKLSSFMDQLQLFRAFTPLLGSSGGPSQFTSTHVLYYESVSISDRYVSSSLSCIISHRTAKLNERVHGLMVKFHPHLVTVFFQNSPGQEKEFKHSVTEFTVKLSFFIQALISSPHLDGLDQQASASAAMQISSPLNFNAQQASSLMVRAAVINIR